MSDNCNLEQAVQALTRAASELSRAATAKTNDDHDILITLVEQMRGIKADIAELKNNTTGRITLLEAGKADKSDLQELEKGVYDKMRPRVEELEKSQSRYMITLALYTTLQVSSLGLLVYHLFQTN